MFKRIFEYFSLHRKADKALKMAKELMNQPDAPEIQGIRFAVHCYATSPSSGHNICMVGRRRDGSVPHARWAHNGMVRAIEQLNQTTGVSDARPMTDEEIEQMQALEDAVMERQLHKQAGGSVDPKTLN